MSSGTGGTALADICSITDCATRCRTIQFICVDLRRGNPVMAHHMADSLKRHAMRQGDCSGVGMTLAVIDQSALYAADVGNPFQICVQGGVAVHR